ncbi:hypothetical protein [Bacillus thuringiensis]|uniref:hypothetical protein n=1 Tax=Bacillus thuringiensis TaxID=1428 RepID=UPI001146096C|nr:hypothetical protein [Bacillus thuringiensis]
MRMLLYMNIQQTARSSITVLFKMAAGITAILFGIFAIVSFLDNDYGSAGVFGGIIFLISGGISAAIFMFMATVIELKEATLIELRQLNEKE